MHLCVDTGRKNARKAHELDCKARFFFGLSLMSKWIGGFREG